MFVLLFLSLLSCSNECTLDITVHAFTERWWQVHYNGYGVSNCYMFKENGTVVEDDGEHKWPSTKWTIIDDSCEIEISTANDKEITLRGFNGVCWMVDVDEREDLIVCDCLY